MKIWAYAKNLAGEYIKGEKHKYRMFFIWEALSMKKNNPHLYNEIKFISTQRDEKDRSQMFPNIGGFFKYGPNDKVRTENRDGDTDSFSHAVAISVLEQMECIKFICGNDEFTITPVSISTETRVILSNGKSYYPDLMITFNENEALASRWGNKVAIEVNHTHECEPEKIHDFQNHCIPIIEVSIKTMSIERKFGKKVLNSDLMEEYFEYVKEKLNNQVFGKILSNPVSLEFHKSQSKLYYDKTIKLQEANEKISNLAKEKMLEITKLNEIIKNFQEKQEKQKTESAKMNSTISALKMLNQEYSESLDVAVKKNNKLSETAEAMGKEILRLKSRTWIDYFFFKEET
ncbi:hypothetical protein H1D31_01340 [Alishewanella sp. BS5-314]|uniref:hypothetical protein n=1 Tax=Alishewanella sp. BS5-314 TaxID=2755587 RepID=UPI0021BAA730|nr:hypothetical protein [Alishewanella sp. BS5-314]MCT8124681.1 hypothetical protein [Alishewanella sp. BS5-314]